LDLKHRERVCATLIKICDAINADKAHIPNCIYAKAFKEDKIKVPFVKVVYNSDFGKNKNVVPSMDIIINNYEGLENSKLLALYAEDEYVLKFCNVIKYWAVNRNLINLQRKMEGLSSYGILLMCLYYLMVSKQIPFLKRASK
jgi:DNA polymerase sigma